jgi:hypothetical protein
MDLHKETNMIRQFASVRRNPVGIVCNLKSSRKRQTLPRSQDAALVILRV